jgi:hypothetical protein
MNPATPVERVVAILKEAGYRELKLPLMVASVPFDFAAALVGTGKASDLIVVIDTVQDSDARTRQMIDGLGRALDVAGSRQPVTAILAGPKPHDPILDAIGRVCRVLPVGTPTGADATRLLHDWLAVLLPLQLPNPIEVIADTSGELAKHLATNHDPYVRKTILEEAPHGPKAVRLALQRLVVQALNDNSGQTAEGAAS